MDQRPLASITSSTNKATSDRATLDKLESEALIRVVRILNAEQRKALLTSNGEY